MREIHKQAEGKQNEKKKAKYRNKEGKNEREGGQTGRDKENRQSTGTVKRLERTHRSVV